MKNFFAALLILFTAVVNAAVYQDSHRDELSKLKYRELVQINLVQNPWQFFVGKVPKDYQLALPQGKLVAFTGCDDGSTIDLDKVLEHKPKPLTEGVLYITFDAPRDGVIHLGISCDWWLEAYVNGVLCVTTMRGGNGFGDSFSCEDHPFFAPVKKGRNLMSIKVKRGNNAWSFSLGRVLPEFPARAEVAAGPWLLQPDSTALNIVFRTAGKVPAGVQYRVANSDKWQTVYDHSSGGIAVKELHRIALDKLQPGAVYEYKIFMLDPRNYKSKVFDKKLRSFKLPDEKSRRWKFLFLSDIQFNPKMQKQHLRKLFRAAGVDDCDFVVFGGDMCNFFVPEVYDEVLLAALPENKPLVMVRGNHELRGKSAGEYTSYFAWRDNRTYGMFRWGDAAFLVLDTLGKSDPKRPGKNERALVLPQLLADQKEFIRKVINTPRWQQAKRRFVFAHAAPCGHNLQDQMTVIAQELTDEFFGGSNPQSLLNMYLAGHTHKYSRTIPGTRRIASYKKLPWPLKTPESYQYPVITSAGPDPKEPEECSIFSVTVDPEKISLKVFYASGRIIEKIEYLSNGQTVENKTLSTVEY